MKTTYYRIGQSVPPRRWHQRAVRWFGKTVMYVSMVCAVTGGTGYYVFNRPQGPSLAAETAKVETLQKVTTPIVDTTPQNIIDIQFVLDKWAKDNPRQQWSVVVESISGPGFRAQLNKDRQYESTAMQELFLTLPLFAQIPAEHQKTVKLSINGKQRSLEQCVDTMVRLSDNVCAEHLARYIDFKKAAEQLKKAGLTKTSLKNHSSVQTTAADTARFMQLLQSEEFGTKIASDKVRQLLREQVHRAGIPAGCPGCVIADKSHNQDKVVADAAIVEYKGGSYIVVIYGDTGSFDQAATLAGRIQQKIIDSMSH